MWRAPIPKDFEEIGEEYHDELEVVRAQLYWRRTVRKKFKSKSDRSRPPLMAPAPEPTLLGTLCGASLAAQVVVEKFCDHLPYYRQSLRMLRRFEAQIGRQTLGGWAHAAAAAPEANRRGDQGRVVQGEAAWKSTRRRSVTSVPATGKTRQGYLWVYLDAQGGTVLYDWQLGRGHDCLLDIIGLDEEDRHDALPRDDPVRRLQRLPGLGGALRRDPTRRDAWLISGASSSRPASRLPKVVLPILLSDPAALPHRRRSCARSSAPPDCRQTGSPGAQRPHRRRTSRTHPQGKIASPARRASSGKR